MLLSMSAVCASADGTADRIPEDAVALSATVYVTISDENGVTALAAEKLTVTDTDEDGALTINDALYLAHENCYEGGAAAGYGASVSQYGLGLTKLWGSTCGSYGYYVNNASAWALTDPVADGDYIAAFVYTDAEFWTDHYSYFDSFGATVGEGEEITLTYTEAGYDEEWNPVTLPVEGAVITVGGEATEAVTDAEGKATITFSGEGSHIVSAIVEGRRLVKPVYIVNMKLLGDADGDGQITVMDATRIQRWLASLATDYEINRVNADADRDGNVTILDATRIQRLLANMITEL